MTFDVATNRIPFGLLTPKEQAALQAWPHGVEYYRSQHGLWVNCVPFWNDNIVYRGKPTPKVTSYGFNIYGEDSVGNTWTKQDAAKRVAIDNSVTLPYLWDVCAS
jgi:hypothetical protein